MKKNFFPVALMALAIGFNACSSDDVTVNANGGGFSPVLEGGYVKMAINMPSQVSGRADEVTNNSGNDQFEDGLAKEFDVKNATLLLFAGADNESEDQAVFHSAYNLDVSMAKENPDQTQITSTTRIVKPVDENVVAGRPKLYAYVLLNNNGLVTYENATTLNLKLKQRTVSPSGATLSDVTSMTTGTTFKTFREYIAANGADAFHADAQGFLMNNAPLYNTKIKQGESTVKGVQTLVPIDDNVYKTKEAAEAADAREVFVERALAKVTMQKNVVNNNNTLSAKDAVIVKSDADGDLNKKFTIEGWTLDVTNKTSYLGRSYDNSWNSITTATGTPTRFIGTTALRTGTGVANHEGASLYRTYWGEDPNYSGSGKEDFNILTKTAVDLVSNGFDNNNPLYCMENTLNVAEMEDGSQVTRAIVKVQFLGGKTFYTFNDDNTTLYTQEKMIDRVKQAILDNTDVFNKCAEIFPGKTIGADDVTITWKSVDTDGNPKRDEDGKIYLESFVISDGTTNSEGAPNKVESSTVFAGATDLNSKLQFGNIMQYTKGLAYYAIPIKHFGKELTPWSSTDEGFTKSTSYNNNDNKYLGRYGVLRNNWYDIAVSGIKYVGSPVVPELKFGPKNGNTPDKVENYIAVRINVLSWAKRTQVEEL